MQSIPIFYFQELLRFITTVRIIDNYVPTFTDGSSYSARMRSPQTNPIYYNPAVTYQPWSNSDGSLMPNAVPTAAFHNPAKTSAGSRNLTVNNTQSAGWDSCNNVPPTGCGYSVKAELSIQRSISFLTVGMNGTGIIIQSRKSARIFRRIPAMGAVGSDPIVPHRICTYNQEIQNFANWYTYYRSRVLLARAGVGRAFAAQGNTMRVGFAAINKGKTTVDGKNNTEGGDRWREAIYRDRPDEFFYQSLSVSNSNIGHPATKCSK